MKDDEIGYGRPPKHTQFQKGKSGNPRGRPKNAPNVNAEFQKLMLEMVTVGVNGVRKRMTRLQALGRCATEAAFKGDMRALGTILNLAERWQRNQLRIDRSEYCRCTSPEQCERGILPSMKKGFWVPVGGMKFTIDLGRERYDDEDEKPKVKEIKSDNDEEMGDK